MIKHEAMTQALHKRWECYRGSGTLEEMLKVTYQIAELLHDPEFENTYVIGATIADTIVGEVQRLLEHGGTTGRDVYMDTNPLIHLVERLMTKDILGGEPTPPEPEPATGHKLENFDTGVFRDHQPAMEPRPKYGATFPNEDYAAPHVPKALHKVSGWDPSMDKAISKIIQRDLDTAARLKDRVQDLELPVMIGTRVFCTFSKERGRLGTVKDFDAHSRRVNVLLDGGTETGFCPVTMFAIPKQEKS